MKKIVLSRCYLEWRKEYCVFEVDDDFALDNQEDSDWEDGYVEALGDEGVDLVDADPWKFEWAHES